MPDLPAISLRPVTEADAGFLLAVYSSTREEELALTGWTDAMKAQFCAMQSQAQHSHYRLHFPNTEYHVIECANEPAGRLYVDHSGKDIGILDISLLPAFRRRGIGGHLLRELQQQARQAAKGLAIHVETFNPARRLYERLGFRLAEDKGVYLYMTWTPETALT